MVRRQRRSWWNVPGHLLALWGSRAGRVQLALYVAIGIILFAAGGITDRTWFMPDDVSPAAARFGWNESIAKTEAPKIAAEMPKFAITDPDGNVVTGAGKSAELWKFAKLANDGKHIPTFRQETGDCVSHSGANAIAYLDAFRIGSSLDTERTLKLPFQPYDYATSRVLYGKRQLGRSPGSVAGWLVKSRQAYGVLPQDKAAELGYRYSGRLADDWGWKGPPKNAVDYASKFRLRTASQVTTWEDCRDALVHGYPVAVASNVGFNGGHYDRDGKRWLRAAGSWPHAMCFIGCEDRPGRTKGCYCINSWGTDAHPRPLNDEPPGGFWVDAQTVQRMVSQGDSWAYSDFDGFPAESTADWNAFKFEAVTTEQEAEDIAKVDQPEPQPVLMETRKMIPLPCLYLTLVVGVGILGGALAAKYRTPKSKLVSGLLIGLSIIGSVTSVDAGHRRRAAMWQQYQQQSPCVNGVCPTGYVAPAGKVANPAAGLPADMQPAKKTSDNGKGVIQLADAAKVPAAMFNAFSEPPAAVQAKPEVNAWTAFPAAAERTLRSYRDCYETEKEFLLFVGDEPAALMELEVATIPIAFEPSHRALATGRYRFYVDRGKLSYVSVTKQPAKAVNKLTVKRQR